MIPETSPVELLIYDLTERLAIAPEQDEYVAGYHNVQLEELAPASTSAGWFRGISRQRRDSW